MGIPDTGILVFLHVEEQHERIRRCPLESSLILLQSIVQFVLLA